MQLSSDGEPVYGPRDVAELDKIRELGLPFWLAGSYGQPGKLAEALQLGAAGIQVGTAFAFCEESGIEPALKQEAIRMSRLGEAQVFTDPRVSPTGFPFKVANLPGTLAEPGLTITRSRICDLGYCGTFIASPMGVSVTAVRLNHSSTSSRKAVPRKKLRAANASAIVSLPRSGWVRFARRAKENCRW